MGPRGIRAAGFVTTSVVVASINGTNVTSGTGAPSGSAGNVGDVYADLSTGEHYEKTGASTWTRIVKAGDAITGTSVNGITFLTGSTDPTSGGGVAATAPAYYTRTGTADMYEKTGSGDTAWTLVLKTGVSAGGDLSGTLPSPSVATVGGKTSSAIAQSVTDTVAATNAATVSTLAKRDNSGGAAFVALSTSGLLTETGNIEHGQTGGPQDMCGLLDPSLGSGVVAPVSSIYKRRSGLAGGVVFDEYVKYAAGNTAWSRTKRSPLLAGGIWAATYPAILRSASATQERDVNRAILADQSFAALPAALFQCDEASNGNAVDAIGGVIAMATTGGDATRGATSFADSVLDRGLITVLNSDNWWRIADTTALDPGAGAFCVDIITRVTAGLAALTGSFVGKYNSVGWLAEILSGDGRVQAFFSKTSTATVNLIQNHLDSNYHRILIGRSVTGSAFFVTSDLGDATTASGTVGDLAVAASFGIGDPSGTHVSGATQTVTRLAWYTGADAEIMYTNRVALCARWATT